MIDAALRRHFLSMLAADLKFVEDAVGADDALVAFCLHGPDTFEDVKRHWYLHLSKRLLFAELDEQIRTDIYIPGGIIDTACRCVCHCVIGSPCEFTQQSCVHCRLLA